MFKSEQTRLFFKFSRYLAPHRGKIIFVILINSLLMLLSLVNPFLTKLVIDRAIGGRDLKLFFILAVSGAAIFVINGGLQGLARYLNSSLGIRVGFDLRRQVAGKLHVLSLAFFQDRPLGQQLYRINYDVDRISGFLAGVIPEAIQVFPRIAITIAILFFLEKRLAVLSMLLSPLIYLPPYYFNQRIREILKILNKKNEATLSKFVEVFSRIWLVKAFGKQRQEFRDYIRRLIDNIRTEIVIMRLDALFSFSNSAINRLITGTIAFYGGYLVIKGKMTLGSLTAIMMYLNQLMGQQDSIVGFSRQLNTGLLSCQRLNDILEAAAGPESAGSHNVVFDKGEIRFQNCTFGYKDDSLVLEDLSFTIEGGRMVALVGPSGCGKTTIVNLILKLYLPRSGGIFIDGQDTKELNSDSLYRQVGIALQEPFLWNDTIENNLRYGKSDASEEELKSAAVLSGVDELVRSLPDGYCAKIGENACKLSQGQKQRIAISRALIKKPSILILDEAMASLDVESERAILERIREVRKGLTTIIISHRPSAAALAEKIYFMESRNKISCGSLSELRHQSSALSSLFNEKPPV